MKVQRFIGVLFLAVLTLTVNAQEIKPGGSISEPVDYEGLLLAYTDNDRQLKELTLSYEQAHLNYSKTFIQNGTGVHLSSGTMNTKFSETDTSVSVSPSVSVSLPALHNSQVKLSSPLAVTFTEEKPSLSINGAGVSLSADIISAASEKRSLTMIKAQRSVDEAQRRLDARKLAIEKEFLSVLKSLYNSKLTLISKQNSLLSKQKDLDSLKAQGYEITSARYRTAMLSYQSALRDAEVQERSFNKDVLNFAHKCSLETISLDFELPRTELLSMESFSKELYKELESSTWAHYINSLSRDASSPLTLTADAGYALSYKEVKEEGQFTNSVSTGVSLKYNGLDLSAGVQLPVENLKNPTLSLSLSWVPSEKKLASISEQEESLSIQQEILSIESSLDSYEDIRSDKEKTREDLIWQMEKNIEQLSMYEDLKKDMKSWYDKGVIALSDYEEALTNYENALVQIKISQIDQLLFNIDLKSLFVSQSAKQE